MVIDGRKRADEILDRLRTLPKPGRFLGAILIGDDQASKSFLKQKEGIAKILGIDFRLYEFPVEISKDALRKEVLKIAQHKTCGSIIVQLPLPNSIDAQYILNAIPPEKDVDVLGVRSLGAFYAGRSVFLPPAVGVVSEIFEILKYENLKTSSVAVLGVGSLVGRPVATWLLGRAREVMVFDKGTDFSLLIKSADVVICGTGVPGLLKPEMLKEGAIVIDFGYGLHDGQPSGDFEASSLAAGNSPLTAFSYTPTPGGTGPILVAKLFENFYKLNAG